MAAFQPELEPPKMRYIVSMVGRLPDEGTTLRLARLEDILRIGVVVTAGLRHSPRFHWERPYHQKHPQDTLQSYRTLFQNAMKSDDVAVVVAEDKYDPNENSKTKAVIPKWNGWSPPASGDRVVVGVMALTLDSKSYRKGQFMHLTTDYVDLPVFVGKDVNPGHCASTDEQEAEALEKHCQGNSMLSMLVVHPAYWRRGHGTKLCQWAIDLSEIDKVKQCVNAHGMGFELFAKLGYRFVCKIATEGDKEVPDGCLSHLMVYTPTKKTDEKEEAAKGSNKESSKEVVDKELAKDLEGESASDEPAEESAKEPAKELTEDSNEKLNEELDKKLSLDQEKEIVKE